MYIDSTENKITQIIKKQIANLGCYKKCMELSKVKLLAERAEKLALEIGVPIVFAAVDEGGNLVLLHRMEGSLLISLEVAVNKAYTANAMKMPTSDITPLAQPGGELHGLQNVCPGKVSIIGGGYPYLEDGVHVGAIAVSGGTVEQDTKIARYALGIQ